MRTSLRLVGFAVLGLAAPSFGATDCTTPLQTYYVPFPAEQVKAWADDLKNDATNTDFIRSVQSITVTRDLTVICYDHWEDGYEDDLRFPTSSTTLIWGDGNLANGVAPGDADDLLVAGQVLPIEEDVPANPRGTTILRDARDKLLSSDPIKVSRAAWPSDASTTNTGAQLGGSVEVYDTNRWGTVFEAPIGEDITTNGAAWEWVGFTVMARADGTRLDVDLDGDGIQEYLGLPLDEGQSVLIQDIRVGAKLVASAPIQVQMITADVGSNYQGRWYSLVPRPDWDNSYWAAMPQMGDGDGNTADGEGLTRIHVYNPNTNPITVRIDHRGGANPDATLVVPPGGFADYNVPCLVNQDPCQAANRTGTHLSTLSEADEFYAVSTVDAPNQLYDWGYTLVEENNLSTELVVGWAKGSTGLATNISPLWVTPIATTTILVDFDGNGTADQTFADVQPLQIVRITDNGDNDQTGTIIRSSPPVKLSGVWGQDPASASSGQPTQLDMGNVIVPSPVLVLQKVDELVQDLDGNGTIDPGDVLRYTIRIFNNGDQALPVAPATLVEISDNLAPGVTYLPGSTTIERCAAYSLGCVPDTTTALADDVFPATTPFPLDCIPSDCSGADDGYALGDDDLRVTLDIDETAILSFEVALDPDYDDSTVTNTTTAVSGSTQSSTSTATSPVPSGGLAITKVSGAGGLVDPGELYDYTVTVTNTGSEVNENVAVYDRVPNGTSYVQNAPNFSTRMTQTFSTNVTVRDEFSRLYSGNDGPNPWQGGWVEIDAAGAGPSAGEIRVSSGALRLNNSQGGTGTPSIDREVDLSTCAGATLSYSWATSAGVDTGDQIQAQCGFAGVGGAFGTTIVTHTGINGAQTGNFSGSFPPSCRTHFGALRFRVATTGSYTNTDEVFTIDDVQIAATGCPAMKVKDLFDDVNYDNEDGTDTWDGPWIETNDDGAPATGDILVSPAGFLRVSDASGGADPTVAREADLSGCTQAGLVVRLLDGGTNLNGNDCMAIEVGNAGVGGAFSQLQNICNDVNSLTTFAYANVATVVGTLNQQVAVRFRVSNGLDGAGESFDIHDVALTAIGCSRVRDNYGSSTIQLADGNPSGVPSPTNGLVVRNDEIDLGPGDSLAIRFRVQADSPLENVDAGISNIATTRSDQQRPVTAFTIDPVASIVRDSAIGDRVWLDADGDGVQDAGEPGIGNVTVELRNGVCIPLPSGSANCPTTKTDSDGRYLFSNLPTGTYTVAVIDATLPNGGAGLQTSPGTTDPTASIPLADGQIYLDADFGYRGASTANAIVGDRVWSDPDGDGLQDPGEAGIGGVTVRLLSPGPDGVFGTGDDVVVATTTTGPDGSYLFTGVVPGKYTVDVVTTTLPGGGAGYVLTSGPQSRGNPTVPFTVVPRDAYLRADFGFDKPATFSITDAVWLDSDEDGVFDAGERPFGGITVALLNASGNVVATTTSAPDGSFTFSGLENGTYTVRMTDASGTLVPYDGTTSFGVAGQRTGIVVFGANVTNQSFGYHARGTVGDTVFNDANQNGVQDPGEIGIEGVRVELLRANGWNVIDGRIDVDGDGTTGTSMMPDAGDAGAAPDGITVIAGRLDLNGDGVITAADAGTWRGIPVIAGELNIDGVGGITGADDGKVDRLLRTAITGPDGTFLFTGLLPGQYRTNVTVAQTALAGFTQTADPDIPGNCGSPGSFCDANGTAFVAIHGSDLTMDYGFRRDDPDVSGTVFEDLDRNAVQNGGEGGFAGVTLDLVKTYRVLDGRIDIDGDGDVDTADDGWADGVRVIDGRLDLDGNGSITGADTGTWRGFAVVGGLLNLDGDGTAGETNGDDSDTIVGDAIATTTTDANGNYTFPNVPGSSFGRDYFVVVTDRAGILRGYELTTGIDTYPITVQTVDVSDVDFGYVRDAATGSIGDTVWIDVDPPGPAGPDGLRGPTEPGIPGVTLRLYRDDGDGIFEPGGDDGAAIATTVTDADGNYLFSGLPPGFYFVDLDGATVPQGLILSAGTDPSARIALTEGERYVDADFGYRPAGGTVVLGDRIWFDADTDGRQDPGEVGLEGIDVILFGPGPDGINDGPAVRILAGRLDVNGDGVVNGSDDGTIDGIQVIDGRLDTSGNGTIGPEDVGPWRTFTLIGGEVNLDGLGGITAADTGISVLGDDVARVTTTGPDGLYLFTELPPGSYSVSFDASDVAALGLGTTPTNPPVSGPNRVWAVTTVAGDVITTLDWGFGGATRGSIGDRIWFDLDGDGVQDTGEPGIGGVTLQAVRVSDGAILATTTTASGAVYDGRLDMDGDGDVDGDDDGHRNGYRVIDGRLDLDGDGMITGADTGTWNGIAVVAGQVDLNGGGVDGTDDGIVAGDYLFSGLAFDEAVQIVVTDRAGLLEGLVRSTAPDPVTRTPTAGTPSFRDADFGFGPTAALGSIGTTVWHDVNDDGVRQPNEPPIEGVTIALWVDRDGNGAISGGLGRALPPGQDDLVRLERTDANGNYEFLGLPFTTYLVGVTDREGTLLPDLGQSTLGAADTDDNNQTNPYPVTLTASNPRVVVADFGYVDLTAGGTATLAGTVFLDDDVDAVFDDPIESVVPGARLTLFRVSAVGGLERIGSTVADINGDYLFTNLGPGSYRVVVDVGATVADGFLQTTQATTGGVQHVTLAANQNSTGNDFGFFDGGVTTTPVTLARFRAERVGAETFHVSWATATEVSTVGFDLWGHDGEEWVPLTGSLVESETGDSLGIRSYETEIEASGITSFLLAELDTRGVFRFHGPFAPERFYGRTDEELALEPIDWTSIRAESLRAKHARRSQRGTAVAAALRVDETGLQRVTYEQLAAAGFDLAGVDPDELALVSRGIPVPIRVLSSGAFGAGAAIEFWGEAIEDSLYTRTRVYRLVVDPALARRIAEESGAPGFFVPESEHRSLWRFERDLAYSIGAPNGDPWFDRRIVAQTGPRSTTVTLAPPGFAGGEAELVVGLWGGIDWPDPGLDHHVELRVGGVLVADEKFDGVVDFPISVELPSGILLGNGTDVLEIRLPRDTGHSIDIVHLDHVELRYDRVFEAVAGRLDFSSEGQTFEVGGLTGSQVTVLERSSTGDVARLGAAAVVPAGPGWTVSFSRVGPDAVAWSVVQESRILTPDVEALGPPADLESGEARLLIVSHPDFVDGLAPLVALRQSQGWTVDVVEVGEVLRQWGDGIFDPQPIRDYIAFAALERGTEAVLLVGGDTSDYLNHLGSGSMSFVPSIHARTGATVFFAPADGLYVDVTGDDVPDLAIGRFPVRTVAELDALVAKTLAFEDGLDRRTLLAVSDDFDEPSRFDFAHATARFVDRAPSDWAVERISLDERSVASARPDLLAALSEGPALTSYMGHSGPTIWTFDGLFAANDALGLTNVGSPTLLAQWGCWTTLYTAPSANTLAHRFLVAGEQGAAAVMGATTLTEARSERALALEVADRLFLPGVTLGRSLLLAKRRLADLGDPSTDDVLLGWVLLGDPTMPGFGGLGPAACEGDPATGDTDGDGFCENVDQCLGSDTLGDGDGDGVCDDLDACPGDDAADGDGDGVCDGLDVCPLGDDDADADGDGVPDACDRCQGDDAEGDPDSDGICGTPSLELFVDGFESGDTSRWSGGR